MVSKGKIFALVLIVIFLCSLVIFNAASLKAVSTKTIVVPDDFSTIQTAIDNANAGDTVFVRGGNYNTTEHSYDNFLPASILIDKPISLMGENCLETIIRTTETYSVLWGYDSGIAVNSDNVTISGFSIVGNTNVIVFGDHSVNITDNIINCTSGDAIQDYGSGIISSNIINGGEPETTSNGTTGIDASSAEPNTIISNNLINGFGIGIVTGNIIITNNTIANNYQGIYAWTSPSLIYGNNIVNCVQCSIITGQDVNASYNWWGTNDTQAIKQTIIHLMNNHSEGNVTFIPFLTTPNSQAMPIQEVTTPTPSSPAGASISSSTTVIIVIVLVVVLVLVISLLVFRRHRRLRT